MSPEERLKEVEAEIASIREDLSKPKGEEFPVGTVLAGKYGALAIRVRSIHSSVRSHSTTDSPMWVTVWADGSGSAFRTLVDLLKVHTDSFRNYTLLRHGGFS